MCEKPLYDKETTHAALILTIQHITVSCYLITWVPTRDRDRQSIHHGNDGQVLGTHLSHLNDKKDSNYSRNYLHQRLDSQIFEYRLRFRLVTASISCPCFSGDLQRARGEANNKNGIQSQANEQV